MGNQKKISQKQKNKTNNPGIPKSLTPVIDNAFTNNTASPNAKLLLNYKDFEIEIWIEKHYENREKDGDDNGKREGIEEIKVKDLVIENVKHILHLNSQKQRSYDVTSLVIRNKFIT